MNSVCGKNEEKNKPKNGLFWDECISRAGNFFPERDQQEITAWWRVLFTFLFDASTFHSVNIRKLNFFEFLFLFTFCVKSQWTIDSHQSASFWITRKPSSLQWPRRNVCMIIKKNRLSFVLKNSHRSHTVLSTTEQKQMRKHTRNRFNWIGVSVVATSKSKYKYSAPVIFIYSTRWLNNAMKRGKDVIR